MSLLKQLLLSVSVALLGILVGTLYVSSHAARSYLTEQLHMQSENAVASLALSLSQPGNQDPVTQELLVSALFDTGQFLRVARTSLDGEALIALQQPQKPSSVPGWFEALMPLPAAQAQRTLGDGWRQIGSVLVQVDNSVAQSSLWKSTLQTSIWVLLAGVAWALFVFGLLRWFQRVLRNEVTAQVERIGRPAGSLAQSKDASSFDVAELNELSGAIADTYARVQKQTQTHLDRIETLEVETNSDSVTNLPNRKYFVNELSKALQSDPRAQGHVLMIRQRDLHSMNTCFSREEVDAWLLGVSGQLEQLLQEKKLSHAQLARLNGSDFVLLLAGDRSLEAARLAQSVRQLLQPIGLLLADGSYSRWAYSLAAYSAGDTAADVLSRLDQGMMLAESSGHGDVEYADFMPQLTDSERFGESDWHQFLSDALERSEQLGIEVQAVTSISMTETNVRHEAALQLQDANGQMLSAGLFLPAAVRLGLTAQFDLQAIGLCMCWLAEHPTHTLIVRISVPSLEQPAFVEGVRELLAASNVSVSGVVLELDAHALEVAPEKVLYLERVLSELGAGIGLRRLDQAPKALMRLSHVPLRFVKVGGAFADQATNNVGIQYLLDAMVQTATAQKARVYVTDMVGPAAADWLRAKGVNLSLPSQRS